jgi:Ca2+-binding EF-hand superfamily protein
MNNISKPFSKYLETIKNDIISIRSNPKSIISRFNIVLYSLKGFKNNEEITIFIERFIEDLSTRKSLPNLEIDPYLVNVANEILNESEKMNVNPDNLTVEEMNKIVNPFIKNYQNLNIIYDTHANPSKFLCKIILKSGEKGSGYSNPNINILFDESVSKIGAAEKNKGKLGHYLILFIDKYEKVNTETEEDKETKPEINSNIVNENVLEKNSESNLNKDFNQEADLLENKNFFQIFDSDNNGFIEPNEFNEIVTKTGIKNSWPLISKFGEILFSKNPNEGVNFEDFIEALITFEKNQTEEENKKQEGYEVKEKNENGNEDIIIRKIFEVYCDDIERDSISLEGLKRIAIDLESETGTGNGTKIDSITNTINNNNHEGNIFFKFAIEKNSLCNFIDFKNFIKNEIKNGNVKLLNKFK